MKRFAIALAAAAFGTVGLAQETTTTIKREQGLLGSSTTIEKRVEPSDSSTTVTTGGIGCQTTTKQKTNDFGDTKTTRKTEC